MIISKFQNINVDRTLTTGVDGGLELFYVPHTP